MKGFPGRRGPPGPPGPVFNVTNGGEPIGPSPPNMRVSTQLLVCLKKSTNEVNCQRAF